MYSREYYHRKRREYVAQLGGVCKGCGCSTNLQFDHIRPLDKCFSVGKILSHSKKEILEELNKCQLLCSYCHNAKTLKEKESIRNKAKGEDVFSAKLTGSEVLEIRFLAKGGLTDLSISEKFGVSRETISKIRRRLTWKHV